MKLAASGPRLVVLTAGLAALTSCGLGTDPAPPPGSPTSFAAEPASTSSIALSWSVEGGAASEFRIDRARGDSAFAELTVVDGDARAFVDTGLDSGERYRYRLRACGSGGCSEPVTAEATTLSPLEIVTPSLPPGFIGVPYAEAVHAEGGDGRYHWSVEAGSLPAGLAIDDTSGIITGTPETADTYRFTLRVRDEGGREAAEPFTIEILASAPDVSIRNPALPPVVAGGAYRVELGASGGDGSYTWSLVEGTLPAGLRLEPDGRIEGTATAADTAVFTLRVESAGATTSAVFSIAVVEDRPDRFAITMFPVVDVPAAIQPHVDSARARWERAITGNLSTVSVPAGFFDPSGCGGFGDAVNGTTTDDVIMIIDITSIDGRGGVLGRAGPCAIRSTSNIDPSLPFVGILTLDADDLEPIVGEAVLTHIIFHEMGHILGFGSLWRTLDLVLGTDSDDPVYVGPEGVDEWNALGGSGSIPVANTGGPGTANVHWREAVFDREIMTGYSEPVGVPQPLSRMSIASMADLGYRVDLSEADPYSLAALLRGAEIAADALGHDHVRTGPILVLEEDGTRKVIHP